MSYSSIDHSFLLITRAYAHKLIDLDSITLAINLWIEKQNLRPILADQDSLSEDDLNDLERETSQLMAAYGSIEKCFHAIDETARQEICSLLIQLAEPNLGRFVQLLAVDVEALAEEAQDQQSDTPQPNEPKRLKEIREREKNAEFKAGRFFAMKQIDGDGMGEIYYGFDKEIGREVAIKISSLGENYSDQFNNEKRLEREAKIQGRLEHPNILPVYGTGRTSHGRPYLALYYIRKGNMGTLAKAIANFHSGRPILQLSSNPAQKTGSPADTEHPKTKPVNFNQLTDQARSDFRDLLSRFIEICRAIDFVHSKSFLHRDLKPNNIMVGNHAETFVIDFGLACRTPNAQVQDDDPILKDDPAQFLTQQFLHHDIEKTDGTLGGTQSYKAPEQHDQSLGTQDERTDVFALGLILCEILTGTRPFYARLPLHVQAMKADEQSKYILDEIRKGLGSLRDEISTIPRPLEAICRKAVSFEMHDRYPTVSQLGQEVENWLANEPVTAYSSQELFREKSARWIRRRPARAATLFASVALVAVGSMAFLGWSKKKNQDLEKVNVRLNTSNTMLTESKSDLEKTNQELEKKRIETLEESRKLAMNQGAWNQAIPIIEQLEILVDNSQSSEKRSRLIDLQLDKLKALDNAFPGPIAASLLRDVLHDYQSKPSDYSKSQAGRLYVLKGDIQLEPLKPGEKSPYAIALEHLETESAPFFYAKGMTEPDMTKAIAYMENAVSLDPYSIRPIVISATMKFWLGRGAEAVSTLKMLKTILPEDTNILAFEKFIEIISMHKKLEKQDEQILRDYFKQQNAEEVYELGFELFPRFLEGDSSFSLITQAIMKFNNYRSKENETPKQINQMIKSLQSKTDHGSIKGNPSILTFFSKSLPQSFSVFSNLIPALMGLRSNEPTIAASVEMARLLGVKLPQPMPKEEAINQFKTLMSKQPVREFARLLLMALLEENRLKEAADLLDHYPERSLTITPNDNFYTVFGTMRQYFSKVLEERRYSKNPYACNRPFTTNQTLADSYKRLIPKLAREVAFKDDSNLATMLVEACELLDDGDLALSILKVDTTENSYRTDLYDRFFDILRAKKDTKGMISYLENPFMIKGDLWSALWIKVHRENPAIGTKHPKLNKMPENPFMPTSIDYPLPLISELMEMQGDDAGPIKKVTPLIIPAPNQTKSP